MLKKVKWYNIFWVRITGVVLILLLIYFGVTQTPTYFNLTEYLKTGTEELKKENKKTDIEYNTVEEKRKKIKSIKDKIQVGEDIQNIKKFEKELQELRKQKPTPIDKISPEELDQYFRQLLKEK
jgi:hypothetical protein